MSDPIKFDTEGQPYSMVFTIRTGAELDVFDEMCRINPDGSVKINWDIVEKSAALYRPDGSEPHNTWFGVAKLLMAAMKQELPIEEKDLSWP